MAGSRYPYRLGGLPAVTGNQPNLTPMNSCAMNPSTKMGIEMTATVLTFTNESKNLSFRIPAQTPAVTPITISMMKA